MAVLTRVPTGPQKQPALTPADPDWALHEVVTEIDKKDEGTPDSWVPRHPDLVRLTGRHPFNCEPTLADLMKHGFVTPASLHYVRNHGAAPRIEWSKHRVRINGLVGKPRTFTMDDLVKLPSITIPVTLVCAGNRRKEENMVRATTHVIKIPK
jgi:nitrate reductase (NAD(P)H)